MFQARDRPSLYKLHKYDGNGNQLIMKLSLEITSFRSVARVDQ